MTNIDKYFEKNLDKESYDFLVELVKSGIYTWEVIEKKVDIEENKIIWQGNLGIEENKIIWKRKVSIEDKKIVWKGNLYIEGTKVKKLKAKRIEGNVDTYGVKSLEDIEIEEEILGYLDIKGTNIDFQLKIIEKVRNGKLEVKESIYFGGEYFKSL